MKLTKLIRENYKLYWLQELKKDIKKILNDNEIHIEIFESGYYGLTFKYYGNKYYVFDQPGHVGLEDQQMPYISLRKNNDDIWSIEPDYFSKAFGDVSMPENMRNDAKKYILQYFSKLAKSANTKLFAYKPKN